MAGRVELLDQPAQRAARVVAMRLLDEATQARRRLGDADHPAALHDFRVAVRRLRSWLRSLRPVLKGSIPKKARRRLGKAARATGRSRDAEVHLEWVRAQREALTARQRRGLDWLAARIEAEKSEGDQQVATKATEAFDAARATLSRNLPVYTVRIDQDAPDMPFGSVMAALVREHAGTLAEQLSGIESFADAERAHQARIAAKRLRYLLEPISDEVDGGSALVRDLASLQDALGDWHDVSTFSQSIIDATAQAGAAETRRASTFVVEGGEMRHALRGGSGRDLTRGLLALASRLRERGQSAFESAHNEWLGMGETFVARTERIARQLEMRRPLAGAPLVVVRDSTLASIDR